MKRWIAAAALVLAAGPAWGQDANRCRQADGLVAQAFDLGQTRGSAAAQKRLLEDALRLCPSAVAHNNLGVLYEEDGALDAALAHYRQALDIEPGFAAAWYGIGDVHARRGSLGPALEAYLHACKDDRDAQRKAKDLLDSGRYKVAEDGTILDKESLLLLFDRSRRTAMEALIAACGFKASVQPELVFRNIPFETGSATLIGNAPAQLREIGEALLAAGDIAVSIAGHTDSQPFQGVPTAESAAMNRRLSRDRAEAVARELAAMGIPKKRLLPEGLGPDQPEAPGNSEAAYARNRRVVIDVKEGNW